MLSWLGFGQKEKQSNTEENNSEVISNAEHDLANEIESIEQVVESVVDQADELITEQNVLEITDNDIESEVDSSADETETSVAELDDVVHVVEPEIANDVTDTPIELLNEPSPEAQLLAEMEIADNTAIVGEEDTADDFPIDDAEQEKADIETSLEVKSEEPADLEAEIKLGFFARLKQGLSRTRQNLGGGLVDLFRGKKIDDDLFEELETHLLLADVGVETTMKIIDSLTQSASKKQLKDASALYELLKIELKKIIQDVSQPLVIPEGEGPFVMLMVGVNGVGKTTTIGKLAKQFQAQGKSVILAAGDTFRAAAVEQLQVWGERNDIPVIAQHTGADSASVIFDAISAAKARKVDVIIADTAGRLQNKAHLMEELKKVVRVMKKLDVNAPHEVMLTLDAGTGQNALSQTKLFDEAVGLTGLTITKLDGTAKGGVVFAIADKHSIPIRYLGVGEGIDDLRPFDGDEFIEAIFSN